MTNSDPNLNEIREEYSVPFTMGMYVRCELPSAFRYPKVGKIVGSTGHYLLVRFREERNYRYVHPTREVIQYLEGSGSTSC